MLLLPIATRSGKKYQPGKKQVSVGRITIDVSHSYPLMCNSLLLVVCMCDASKRWKFSARTPHTQHKRIRRLEECWSSIFACKCARRSQCTLRTLYVNTAKRFGKEAEIIIRDGSSLKRVPPDRQEIVARPNLELINWFCCARAEKTKTITAALSLEFAATAVVKCAWACADFVTNFIADYRVVLMITGDFIIMHVYIFNIFSFALIS